MAEPAPFVHPYMPNSAPEQREAMLRELGLSSIEELFRDIPDELRFHRRLDLPDAILAESALRRHGEELMRKNVACDPLLNFRGAGCFQHYVPAVCDEIARRASCLSAYSGYTYSDKGKYQATFEYQSLLGELIGMDVVTAATYDGATASGTALRMACRLTSRSEILLPASIKFRSGWR